MDPSRWQNLGYLFWAYALFGGLVVGYLVLLSRRLARLRRDIESLRRQPPPA